MANNAKDIDKILQEIKSKKALKEQPFSSPVDKESPLQEQENTSKRYSSQQMQEKINSLLGSDNTQINKLTAIEITDVQKKKDLTATLSSVEKDIDISVPHKEKSTSDLQPNIIAVKDKSDINGNSPAALSYDVQSKEDTPLPKADVTYSMENYEFSKSFDEVKVKKDAQTIVDDKFVSFFTQSIAVPKETSDKPVTIKKKKHGFFKHKYITDSLSLSIDEEDMEKAVHKQKTSDNEHSEYKQPPVAEKKAVLTSVKIEEKNITASEKPEEKILQQTRIEKPAAATITAKAADSKEDIVNDITAMFMAVNSEEIPEEVKTPVKKPLFSKIKENFQSKDEEDEDEDIVQTKKTFLSSEQALSQDEPVFEPLVEENTFINRFTAQDPQEILEELSSFKFTLVVRLLLSGLCAVVLFYLNLGATMGMPLPSFLNPAVQPMIFYTVSLIFFITAVIGFLPTIINGFTSLVKAPTPDSFLSLASVMCLIQLILCIATASKIDVKTTTVFAGFLVFAFAFNAWGKIISANTIIKNLALANVPEGINAGCIIKDSEVVKRLAKSLDEKAPQVLVSRKTNEIQNFISAGFSIYKGEYTARKLAILSYAVTILSFIISLVVSKSFSTAVFSAAGASVLQIPLSHSLVSTVPASRMQKSLQRYGALVNGWEGIESLSKTTHVSLDAKHLFPKGTVVLHGIKTFQKDRIDLAILYAASILIEKCESLRPVFMNVIENKTDMLYTLDNCEYHIGQGYLAWIENCRVIIGNRSMMSKFDIDLPPLSMETQFTQQGKKPIYLSVNGQLFGMFVVSYHPDSSVKTNLDKLIANGVNVMFESSDFNIDAKLIEKVYTLPADTVQVLGSNETALLSDFTSYTEKTDACMAHLDSLYSLVEGFCAAEGAKAVATTCKLIQGANVVVGAVLALWFAYSQTLFSIPLTSVFLLALGWTGLCLIRAFVKKYD